MIPSHISREHIIAAMGCIDRQGIPPGRDSRTYEVWHGGRIYPPKLLISVAHEVATGDPLPSDVFTGGQETNRFLKRLGVRVTLKGGPKSAEAPAKSRPQSQLHTSTLGAASEDIESLSQSFLHSAHLYTWGDLKVEAGLPRPVPGIYVWFFKSIPPGVPTDGCTQREGMTLLYMGISPDSPTSQGTLRNRIRFHYTQHAEGSTLRLTLGCLLEKELGTLLRRVGRRMTFGPHEVRLSEWMKENAAVAWVKHDKPWMVERELIRTLNLPLNIEGNEHHPFCATLRAIRDRARKRGKDLPNLVEMNPSRGVMFLVACVSRKESRLMAARDLYCSDWFRKARAYAEASGNEWFILSAKHGLVAPKQLIEPYNLTLKRMTREQHRAWAAKVLGELKEKCHSGDKVIVLAPQLYRQDLVPALREWGCDVEEPLRGLGIGKQLQWMKRKLESPGSS